MSEKERLYIIAMKSIKLLELCTIGQAKKAISKTDYVEIKSLAKMIQAQTEGLP